VVLDFKGPKFLSINVSLLAFFGSQCCFCVFFAENQLGASSTNRERERYGRKLRVQVPKHVALEVNRHFFAEKRRC